MLDRLARFAWVTVDQSDLNLVSFGAGKYKLSLPQKIELLDGCNRGFGTLEPFADVIFLI